MPTNPAVPRLTRTQLLKLLPACLCAAGELALARLQHFSIEPRYILDLNAAPVRPSAARRSVRLDALAQRIAYVIPRVAACLPWRADCLVQAMAAQRWLRRYGIASHIVIGTRRGDGGEFLAHAWLKMGDAIITGGVITAYETLLDPSTEQP